MFYQANPWLEILLKPTRALVRVPALSASQHHNNFYFQIMFLFFPEVPAILRICVLYIIPLRLSLILKA
jgi:hypothetical protein